MSARRPGEADTCRHCGQRIVLVNYALGPKWVHQAAEKAFSDDVSWYCRTAVAEPGGLEVENYARQVSDQITSTLLTDRRICRICGCTDEAACMVNGPCYWVAADLCSACKPGPVPAWRAEIVYPTPAPRHPCSIHGSTPCASRCHGRTT